MPAVLKAILKQEKFVIQQKKNSHKIMSSNKLISV